MNGGPNGRSYPHDNGHKMHAVAERKGAKNENAR